MNFGGFVHTNAVKRAGKAALAVVLAVSLCPGSRELLANAAFADPARQAVFDEVEDIQADGAKSGDDVSDSAQSAASATAAAKAKAKAKSEAPNQDADSHDAEGDDADGDSPDQAAAHVGEADDGDQAGDSSDSSDEGADADEPAGADGSDEAPDADDEAAEDGSTDSDGAESAENPTADPADDPSDPADTAAFEADDDDVVAFLTVDDSVALPDGAYLSIKSLLASTHADDAEEADEGSDDEEAAEADDDDESDAADDANDDAAAKAPASAAASTQAVSDETQDYIVITPEGEDDADADYDAAEDADVDDAADAGAAEGAGEAAGEGASAQASIVRTPDVNLKGKDAEYLADLTAKVTDYLQTQEEQPANPLVMTDAYVVQLLNEDDEPIAVPDEAAHLTLTFKDGARALSYESLYAVELDDAAEVYEPEQEAPVDNASDTNEGSDETGDKDSATDDNSTDDPTVATQSTDDESADTSDADEPKGPVGPLSNLTTDEETGESTLEIEGVKSVVALNPYASGSATTMAKGAVPAKAPGGPLKVAPYNQPAAKDSNVELLSNKGFSLNLFNYYAYDEKNGSGNQKGNPNPVGINSVDGTNNTLRAFQFYRGGTEGNGYNNFGGMTATPIQGILQNELRRGSDGNYYPVLANNRGNGTDLKYLFDATPESYKLGNETIKAKEPYIGVDGLFKRDGKGYLYYDSNKNYAYYDTNTSTNPNKRFTLYSDTYTKANDRNYRIGFFPFDQWNASSNDSANPGYKDHHLGLSMHGTFTMPEAADKKVTYQPTDGSAEQRNPMLFEFGGDDDMWVFVDGVLVLDLGGIHQPVHGAIDFTNGTVNIYGDPLNNRLVGTTNASIKTSNDSYGSTVSYNPNGSYTTAEGKTYSAYTTTIDEMFKLVDPNKTWSSVSTPGSSHTIDVFYLERGSYDSNLLIRMNLPLTQTTDLNVEKNWVKSGKKETDHHDSLYVQLYQQRKLTEATGDKAATYSEPRPYGAPVELKSGDDWKHCFSGLPVHSDRAADYYYYTVKEGYVINGEFIPADDGWIVSDNNVYTFVSTEYAYDGDENGARVETYPQDENAAFHNGNQDETPTIGTATITNKREGRITAEKLWLNENGSIDEETSKFQADEVAVQLVKLTKKQGSSDFSDASEQVIATTVLNENNNWHAGFESNDIVEGDGYKYIVREGQMVGGSFVASETLNVTPGVYQHDSTDYYRTIVSSGAGSVGVQVADRAAADFVERNTHNMFRWLDDHVYADAPGVTHYWLNRTIGADNVELEHTTDNPPARYEDNNVLVSVRIPYTASGIEATSEFDYKVDISLENTSELTLNSVVASEGLSAGNYAITNTGQNSYQLVVPASWAKQHAGELIRLKLGVSTVEGNPRKTLEEASPRSSAAALKVVPTDYIVSAKPGFSASMQDSEWPSGDGIVLASGGTGHAVISNKPTNTADFVLKKTDASDADATLKGAEFKLLVDDGALVDKKAVFDAERDTEQYPNEDTTFTTGDDGTISITGLMPGTYWLVEIAAPTGYVLRDSDKPVQVVVGSDGSVSIVVDEPVSGSGTPDIAETAMQPSLETAQGTYTVVVPNMRTYSLPSAGGPGMIPFLFAGAFIATLAAGSGFKPRRFAAAAAGPVRHARRRR